jgi:hypothetical protein
MCFILFFILADSMKNLREAIRMEIWRYQVVASPRVGAVGRRPTIASSPIPGYATNIKDRIINSGKQKKQNKTKACF